ncbi:hypothetical protein STENM327S_08691 [Streptomyces tendae]
MAKQIKGILGEKLGMTQVWDANNRVVPVTVVKAGPNVVTQVRTNDVDGYESVQIAFGEIDPRKVNKPLKGHFAKADVTPRRHLVEIRTADAAEYTLGQEVTAEVFEAGIKVDVTGKSKGKGFAGVMKRHNFKGLGAGHGTQRKHRSPGSIGGCATPGRVFKGLRMAGRMGNERVTTQNLTVHAVDAEKGLLLIKGAVPGPNGGLVLVRTAAPSAPPSARSATPRQWNNNSGKAGRKRSLKRVRPTVRGVADAPARPPARTVVMAAPRWSPRPHRVGQQGRPYSFAQEGVEQVHRPPPQDEQEALRTG